MSHILVQASDGKEGTTLASLDMLDESSRPRISLKGTAVVYLVTRLLPVYGRPSSGLTSFKLESFAVLNI